MSVSPVYIGYRLEAFTGVFTPICIVATALRFYARSLVVKHYDAGDWLIIAALIAQLVAGGIAVGKFSLLFFSLFLLPSMDRLAPIYAMVLTQAS